MSIINGERYHVSDEEIVKVYDSKQEKSFLKPSGFWYCYANDKEEHEMYPFSRSSGFIYKVNLKPDFTTISEPLSPNKILKLDNTADIGIFTEKYLVERDTWSSLIDWNRVKSDYGGVDFSNYNKRLQTIKFNFVWYGSVDFSSGCIWESSLVERIELIRKI